MQLYVNSVSDVFRCTNEKRILVLSGMCPRNTVFQAVLTESVKRFPSWNLRREGDLRAQQLQQQSGDLAGVSISLVPPIGPIRSTTSKPLVQIVDGICLVHH